MAHPPTINFLLREALIKRSRFPPQNDALLLEIA